MKTVKCLVTPICLIVGGAFAAHASLSAQPTSLAIKAGRILNVRTGSYLSQQMIWIEGDRIKQTGAIDDLSRRLPRGSQIVDLAGVTVLPGLIDAHTHLTVDSEAIARATAAARAALADGAGTSAPSGPQPTELARRNARVTLEAGFTTVRNLGAPDAGDIVLRDAIRTGNAIGPRMLAAGTALTGGVRGVAEVRAALSKSIEHGADAIKFFATGGVLLGNDVDAETYSADEMRTIIETAHARGRRVAAHAHGTAGIKDAVLAGVDSVEHGSGINQEIIQLMKQRGTYLVPTVYVAQWYTENAEKLGLPQRQGVPGRRENLARAFREGVKVAFGTDAAPVPHGLNAREFSAMVALGLTPLQAIQAATLNAADLLGWSDRVGTLEAGTFADIIGVDGDPLSNVQTLEHVRFVMKGGEVVKAQ